MAYRTKKQCRRPGCYKIVESGEQYCKKHKRSKLETQKMYNYRWNKARTNYLHDYPLCIKCKEKGLIVPADVVDHIKPHRGNKALFWNQNNWQSLCHNCHNRKTAKEVNDE